MLTTSSKGDDLCPGPATDYFPLSPLRTSDMGLKDAKSKLPRGKPHPLIEGSHTPQTTPCPVSWPAGLWQLPLSACWRRCGLGERREMVTREGTGGGTGRGETRPMHGTFRAAPSTHTRALSTDARSFLVRRLPPAQGLRAASARPPRPLSESRDSRRAMWPDADNQGLNAPGCDAWTAERVLLTPWDAVKQVTSFGHYCCWKLGSSWRPGIEILGL